MFTVNCGGILKLEDGARCRFRTCDPYRVKGDTALEW